VAARLPVTTSPTLLRSQAARRAKVIQAAMQLAADGGYDAVQMRDVATSSNVALGTIYRYYSSKDHLLAEALVEFSRGLQDRMAARPLEGTSVADRVAEALRRSTRSLTYKPQLASALLAAISSRDPAVSECQQRVTAVLREMLIGAMAGDLDEARQDGVIRVLAQVWFAALLGWVNGWMTVNGVVEELEHATQMLLPDE